jgi:hypothetical protein
MTFYYAARATYDKNFDGSGILWAKYIEWSRLTQLTELVSVDSMLNEDLVESDRNNSKDWNYIVIDKYFETGFYTSLNYILSKVSNIKKFNLLAVVIEPDQRCETVSLEDFSFVGYDLLDKDYSVSALSNCGGFDEIFLPTDLNQFGLIEDYDKVYEIKSRLLENNPNEHHADTNVIAIWRHLKIGRPI